jgi:hypothetical protein
MTPKQFKKAMLLILRSGDLGQITKGGFRLIEDELGRGVPEYVPTIYLFCKRLVELGGPVVGPPSEGNVINLFDRRHRPPVK